MAPRYQRWLLNLGEYSYDIEYLKFDYLSRIKTKASSDSVDPIQFYLRIFFKVDILQDYIPITEEIVNKYKIQIIITINKTHELSLTHGKRKVYIAEYDWGNHVDILRR